MHLKVTDANYDEVVTVRVFPHADHTFRVSRSAAGKFAWPETATGYLRTLLDWTAMVTR